MKSWIFKCEISEMLITQIISDRIWSMISGQQNKNVNHFSNKKRFSMLVVVVSTPSRAWARTGSQTPARGPPSFSPHTSSSAATPTGSVHKSQTVSVVGMSGQLKRCNESWFGSLQSGQFAAAGWQGLFCVGRSWGEGICLSWVGKVCVG